MPVGIEQLWLSQTDRPDISRGQFRRDRTDRAEKCHVQSGRLERDGFVDRDPAGAALDMAEVIQHDDRADSHGQVGARLTPVRLG